MANGLASMFGFAFWLTRAQGLARPKISFGGNSLLRDALQII
ncbi:hypothetical protein [Qipengyuania xiamenensis]|nr:hypothetical protein [Qipengyuania xiamenensis]